MDEQKYPIAEIFRSPQGEGVWSGVAMTFVRFAGCNVGKPYTNPERVALASNPLAVIHPYQEKCVDAFGNAFSCDTNFHKTASMTVQEIVDVCDGCERVCLTGGEPLLHNLLPLIEALRLANKLTHIETSGTLSTAPYVDKAWITISPKQGYLVDELENANEIKVLVGEGFNEAKFIEAFGKYIEWSMVCISPINYEHQINHDNVGLCLDLQRRHTKLRLSLQLHKVIGCR